ncbi:hypothetical protein AMS68_007126 [Peltaster fructicola]|uniref:trans-L-3-hydroxyproline dehydratase n=1 Tax=Peltaster fructicola TaxID=286661 RepID=A0A6H0Y435_9PEZI|nr:hypothetical protein AMS68_007126 [Peltaster fructicola]
MSSFWIQTEDWHTAGEPFRIVPDLPAGSLAPGLTVAEQRQHIIDTSQHPLDLLRQSLCHEPRGHADMYGGFILPPNDANAHFGVLFWHKDGFSTACGHGTIALGAWAIANGIVKFPSHLDHESHINVVVDVPSGRVTARAHITNGEATHFDFVNVASYALPDLDRTLDIMLNSHRRRCHVEMAFGGAVYAAVDVRSLDMTIDPKRHLDFIDVQRQIKTQLKDCNHLGKYDVYGVIFYEHMASTDTTVTQRNVVVFADGQIDRSPCGSGTSARIALLLKQSQLTVDQTLVHHSILGTTFEAGVEALTTDVNAPDVPVCIPFVRGMANLTARCSFFIDPNDPIYPGFLFR